MAYQVARACAVAGYTDLYLELDVLPEVSVAEEARDAGAAAIYEHIMAWPVRYRILDDYSRTVRLDNLQPASVNGDTAVRSLLDMKQAFQAPDGEADQDDDDAPLDAFDLFGSDGYKEMLFNITEDQCVDELGTDMSEVRNRIDYMLSFLYSPLPADLPVGNKDLLILMAAYYGDVDRYARLRRPKMHESEPFCVVRGIYHNTMFAKWWSLQSEQPDGWGWTPFSKAITARFIMSNDLSRIIECPDIPERQLPYLVWYPAVARPTTYAELARRRPEMRHAVLRAAIYADMRELLDEVLPQVTADAFLLAEAKESPHPGYLEALGARAGELGVDVTISSTLRGHPGQAWKLYSVRGSNGPDRSHNRLPSRVVPETVTGEREQNAVYNGLRCDVGSVGLFTLIPEAWRPEGLVELDYKQWPPPLVAEKDVVVGQ